MADRARYSFASQLAILKSCPDIISRLLKSGGSVLLAAKLLVISRLLHTRLSQRSDPPFYLNILRTKLGSLRKRLLNRIERRFKRLDVDRDMLVEAMCAYSLATSSSAKDVLRHYHHMRQEEISDGIEEGKTGHEHLLVALRLYMKTSKDTHAIAPNQLSYALEKLKSISLIKSKDVSALVELNLDVHGRWIDDDITSFTPFVRHDDLHKVEAEALLKQWARRTFQIFLNGLKYRVQDVQDPSNLMQLRRETIEFWLSSHQHSTGIDSTEALDELRNVFNTQGIHIAQSRASKLDNVKSLIENHVQHWQSGNSDSSPSLWDSSMIKMDMSQGGAKGFRKSLASRSLGENEALSSVWREYTDFLKGVEAVEEVIKNLREAKWADEFVDVDDEDDLLDNKQTLLSKDDPGLWQEKLEGSLQEYYTDFQTALSELRPHESDESSGYKSCFLLRIWRQVRQHLPLSYQDPGLGSGSILELHEINAGHVLHLPLQKCSSRLRKVGNASDLPARPLWEGDPQLPNLPSLWAYRLLLDLTASMTACGGDIWNPQATDALKILLRNQMVLLTEELFKDGAVTINGHTNYDHTIREDQEPKSEDSTDLENTQQRDTSPKTENATQVNGLVHHPDPTTHSHDTKVQTVFDLDYLINATTSKDSSSAAENGLIVLQKKFTDELALETESVDRMKKDASEYWKRTSLLFGLLA